MATEPTRLVLVIDDDEGIRDLLSLLIKKEGFRVETAADGEEGHRRAMSLKPDLIVLDLMLPRYGGFELLRQLQGTELARVPIIVVTGRYTDSSTADLIRQETNVVELLEKPVKTARFLGVLRRILRPSLAAGDAVEN
ncbi:MAG: response regulator [Elusimicrobiota bacterium]